MEILLPFNILIKLGVFNPLKSSSKIYCGELNCTIHIVQVKCQWFCLMGFFWVVLFCFVLFFNSGTWIAKSNKTSNEY